MPEALAFDMYGTLVDPLGVARRLEGHELDAASVAAGWREAQLRYAALLTAMERYEDFAWVTERSLEHALAVAGAELDVAARKELVRAYDELDAFPDTLPGLVRLREAGHTLVVLSNGTRDMIERVLAHAGIRECFEELISVDEVGRFKPSPRVYRHAAERLGRAVDDAWLVSANPFDVIGASSAGMRTAWVDRRGVAFDPLGPKPELAVRDLGELADALGRRR